MGRLGACTGQKWHLRVSEHLAKPSLEWSKGIHYHTDTGQKTNDRKSDDQKKQTQERQWQSGPRNGIRFISSHQIGEVQLPWAVSHGEGECGVIREVRPLSPFSCFSSH